MHSLNAHWLWVFNADHIPGDSDDECASGGCPS
jgi:hypothetical protein